VKGSRLQLAAASVALALWMMFLAVMAFSG
jgi:hypothetical protein